MIPIKNPNISTNRYKQLLWYEINYKKIHKQYLELIKDWKKYFNENILLKSTIENLTEEINCLCEKGKISEKIKTSLVKTLVITENGIKKNRVV